MNRRLLRIDQVGYGHGSCNAFDGNKLCGKEAEWISSIGARKGPDSVDWEPLRYCKKHWLEELRQTAQRDQEEAAYQARGYPLGATLVSLVVHLGFCAIQEKSHSETVWSAVMRSQRRDAVLWLRNWMQDFLKSSAGDLDMLRWHVNSLGQWLLHQTPGFSPLIDDHFDTRGANDGFSTGLRAGLPIARELLKSL